MAIVNPQFAFLEADLVNPNLKEVKSVARLLDEKLDESAEIESGEPISKYNSTALYLKTYPFFMYSYVVPADIYSAALFLFIKTI